MDAGEAVTQSGAAVCAQADVVARDRIIAAAAQIEVAKENAAAAVSGDDVAAGCGGAADEVVIAFDGDTVIVVGHSSVAGCTGADFVAGHGVIVTADDDGVAAIAGDGVTDTVKADVV